MCKDELPPIGSMVLVEITKVDSEGASCILLEYANHEAFLSINDWSRKRIKNVNFTRPGTRHVVQVVRSEAERGYVDVAKKHVTPQEAETYEAQFKKTCVVHNMFQRVSQVSGAPMLSLYTSIGWPLAQEGREAPTPFHSLDAFTLSLGRPEILAGYLDALIFDHQADDVHRLAADELKKIIAHRLKVQPVKVVQRVKVMCYSERGIDAVKDALLAGRAAGSTDEFPLAIAVESCPIYTISTSSLNEEGARKAIQKCMDAIRDTITSPDVCGTGGGIFEKISE